ncbi:hypothetical protein EDD17DRAFT_1509302 [Pisolithus thermaeus]|nr:hypothetical protein EDD17DRAFT_1509302 [Pisolithus thermaeus]
MTATCRRRQELPLVEVERHPEKNRLKQRDLKASTEEAVCVAAAASQGADGPVVLRMYKTDSERVLCAARRTAKETTGLEKTRVKEKKTVTAYSTHVPPQPAIQPVSAILPHFSQEYSRQAHYGGGVGGYGGPPPPQPSILPAALASLPEEQKNQQASLNYTSDHTPLANNSWLVIEIN